MMVALLSNELVLLTVIFLAVAGAVLGIAGLSRRDPFNRRVGAATGAGTDDMDTSLIHKDSRSNTLKMLEPFQRALAQSDPRQVKVVRQRMIEAGFYNPSAVETYFTVRVVGGLALAFLVGAYLVFFGTAARVNFGLFYVLGAAAFGYYLPALLLSVRIDRRREAFKNGMPEALDMILVGVEAGLSLPASLKHVCDELGDAHPIVAEQFQTVLLEFQAGKSRADSLIALAKRMNIQEVRTFSSMVIQSESLGTSLAQTLQVMADEMRRSRMLDAEKKAAELPVKMAVPLVLFVFPALGATIMTPAIIATMRVFETMGN